MENVVIKPYNPIWWSIGAIVVGLLMVIWPDNILNWAVWIIGIVSLVAGVVQLISYFVQRARSANRWRGFPLLAVLAVIWGIMLLAQPEVWVRLLMVVLALPMILLAIDQMISLGRIRKAGLPIKWTYYIFPILLLVSGGVVLFNPFTTAVWLVIFVGAWIIAYGVIEMFTYFSIKFKN